MTAKAGFGGAAIALAALGCTRSASPPGPMASALLTLSEELGAEAGELEAAPRRLDDIAQAVTKRHRRGATDIAQNINAVLWGELGFEREIESDATRFFRLSTVLANQRGDCLGLGALYLAIGERVGAPLDGVLLPGHFFVRTRGPASHNVELLRRGEAMPDDWYHEKYGPWPEPDSAYARPVSLSELVAIHWYNRGNDLLRTGDLEGAGRAFARAVRGFPDFAQAHANLGTVQHLRGDLAAAAASYHAAARLWPDLPGLAGNWERLQQDLAAAAP
jgi:regulator of sirC expression with transglutaminase-like and TPR domain